MPRTRLLVPVLAIAGWLLAAPAQATLVTYSTVGAFNGGALALTDTLTIGGLEITFNGLTNQSVDTDPFGFTFGNLGSFVTECTGCAGTVAIPGGTTFTLQITQSVPGPSGSQLFPATLMGSIDQTTSTGSVVFSVTTAEINGIKYTLGQNPVPLQPESTNAGVKTIDVVISDLTVPEPTSMLLLGTGLFGVAVRMRRRQ